MTHMGQYSIAHAVQHNSIASYNGLSPVRCQAIIGSNAVILQIRPQETYFNNDILFKIEKFSFMHMKMSFAKWRPFYLVFD